ncbi:hypothetical protein PBY51_010507 [Eleginops maclovinus]|uniref:Uncharacterized protein n=1 Tax=Eleginops maclovinus TaxID=56733 RepID=A0AAN7X413_ELEMC|nr:hypothetical protein PBY51_010507 [Eleginops maclovinus]
MSRALSLGQECFITPSSYVAHIPARRPAAKPYHMAPAFHERVWVYKKSTRQSKPWIPSGRCEVLVPASALRPAAVDVYSARWPQPLLRALIYWELAGAAQGVYE